MVSGSQSKNRPPGPRATTVRQKRPEAGVESPGGCLIYVNLGEVGDQGKRYALTAGTAVIGRDEECELSLADNNISRRHAAFEVVESGILVRDLGSTNGVEHRGERIDQAVVQAGTRLVVGRSVIDLLPLTESPRTPLSERRSYGDLVGVSEPMRRLFAILESLENSDAPVLIEGETGTGKELTAQALHRHGSRSEMPFVIIDCSAIPKELMESELFGHAKGAFTGAVADRKGAFEAADNGTVFLDELDDLPLSLQPKLLRVLETGQVRRVGETGYRSINARVIATTKRDLVEAVRQQRFRSDLYYRLAVVKLRLPPLRERVEDIPVLAHHLMERIVGQPASLLSPQAQDYMMRHQWPGNVRQLRNAVERMLALRGDPAGDASQLHMQMEITGEVRLSEVARPEDVTRPAARKPERTLKVEVTQPSGRVASVLAHEDDEPLEPYRDARKQALQRFEREYLEQLMARSGENLSRAARLAGIDRKYVRNLLKKHGLYQE